MGPFQYAISEHTFALLVMLIGAFLLGLLLGWLIWNRKRETNTEETTALRATLADRDKDLKSAIYAKEQAEQATIAAKAALSNSEADQAVLRAQLARATNELNDLKNTDISADEEIVADDDASTGMVAAASGDSVLDYGSIFASDNLQLIEGIGATKEELLIAAGYKTWADLANADDDDIEKVIERAGIETNDNEIEVWQHQAKLLADGKWEELVAYQKEIDKNKRGVDMPTSKAERLGLQSMGLSNNRYELDAIEGIDPKAEAILNEAGVNSWEDIAAKSDAEIMSILDNAGYEYDTNNVATWNQQAQYAAAGDWTSWKSAKEDERSRVVLTGGLTALAGVTDEALGIFEKNGIGSLADLANTDSEVLAAAFKDSTVNYTYLKRQADFTQTADWDGMKTYQGVPYAMAFREDNLQVIEGVGPKLEELLKKNGLTSWAQVAATTPADLKAMLEKEGPRYRMHDPTTWPKQAKMAQEEDWKALVHYQKYLDVGKETGGIPSPSKVEKLMGKMLGIVAVPNDLKVVEGIGPKIEGLLKAAGINNWEDLADTSVERLKEILTEAGDSYRLAVPTSWPKQAELAASGKWVDLKEYQQFLRGGR